MEGIGLSTIAYDLDGARYLRGEELDPVATIKNESGKRRASRTATLDGGVAVYDTGYAPGDRSLTVRVLRPTPEIMAYFAYLVETYGSIRVSTRESVFLGVPGERYFDDDGAASLVIGITEDIGG